MTIVAADLPRALQPWREWLGWFDAELAEQVGEMVRRLSDMLGVAPSVGRGGQPEPDGLGDLRSRGPYERLLATEWLLADELPDEFLRRAAASEHLFVAPRLRAARVERSVVAIFDCGPRALGAARLAHIAAWILLARLAAENGGTLRWGVLQAPGELRPGDAPTQLGALMHARRFEPATALHAAQWRAALAQLSESGERETWWIVAAGPGLPDGSLRDDRSLALRALLAGDALEACLGLGGAQRRTTLPLPPTPQTTALLRGDFKAPVAPRQLPANRTVRANRMSLTQGLLMSAPPGQVAVPELGQPAMLVFTVPRRGQTKLAKPRRQQWSTLRPPLAAALGRGETHALCASGQNLHFWQMPKFAVERERPPREQFEASASTGRLLPMIVLQGANHQRACVLDAADTLVTWSATMARNTAPPPEAIVVDRKVRAMAPLTGGRLVYAMTYGDGIWLRTLAAEGGATTMHRRLCGAHPRMLGMFLAVAGYNSNAAQLGSLAVGFRRDDDVVLWQIFNITKLGQSLDQVDGAEMKQVQLGQGDIAMGLARQQGTEAPALVVMSADRRRLRLVTASGYTLLHESAATIERCSVCPLSGHVAVLTRDRQLVVIDPADREPLLIVTDNEPAPAEGLIHDDG